MTSGSEICPDNSRTRWGRRRPFIAIGAILSANLLRLGRMDAAGTEAESATELFHHRIDGLLVVVRNLLNSVQRPRI